MLRRLCLLTLAAVFVAGLAASDEPKEANGTVKAVEQNAFTITDSDAKEWTFAVDKETLVLAKGASHKMDKLTAEGKPSSIGEFLAEKQTVTIKYVEKDGKMIAKEVRVKGPEIK